MAHVTPDSPTLFCRAAVLPPAPAAEEADAQAFLTPSSTHPDDPEQSVIRRTGAVVFAFALLGGLNVAPAVAAPSAPSGGAPCAAGVVAGATCLEGQLEDGTPYEFVVPQDWDGTVVVALDFAGPGPTDELTRRLLDDGIARGGTSRAITGWDIRSAIDNQAKALAHFEAAYGPAGRAITAGSSMGGFVSAGTAQVHPDVFDAAVPMCGGLGGSVAQWNQKLDTVFVLEELVAPGLPVIDVQDVPTARQDWIEALSAAQQTSEGRARIALAAAIGQLPSWGVRPDGTRPPEPARTDTAGQQEGAFLALAGGPLPYIGQAMSSRAAITAQVGGNPSSNTGVDYARQLRSASPEARSVVRRTYAEADLDVQADLDALAEAPRIAADPGAVDRFARGIVFDGDLQIPVLTLSGTGDQISTVAQQDYYGDLVRRAGANSLLRQTYTESVGHCTFSAEEQQAAVHTVLERLERGHWPSTSARAMNDRSEALGAVPAPRYTNERPPQFNRPVG